MSNSQHVHGGPCQHGLPPNEGPGPVVFRVQLDPDNDDPPLGSVLIDFHSARNVLSVVANNSAEEAQIRARLDTWALQHVGELLRRVARELPVPTVCDGSCRCREAGR